MTFCFLGTVTGNRIVNGHIHRFSVKVNADSLPCAVATQLESHINLELNHALLFLTMVKLAMTQTTLRQAYTSSPRLLKDPE